MREKAVQQQYPEYLESNKLLTKFQFGYRKNKYPISFNFSNQQYKENEAMVN